MFYWRPGEAETALRSWRGGGLRVAVGYLEEAGVKLLRDLATTNGWSVDQVKVYLPPEFGGARGYELLADLRSFCTVLLTPERLHAKVLLLAGDPPTLFFGSANLTRSGLATRLEFGSLMALSTPTDRAQVEAFFATLESTAHPLDDALHNLFKNFPEPSDADEPTARFYRPIYEALTAANAAKFRPLDGFYFDEDDYQALRTGRLAGQERVRNRLEALGLSLRGRLQGLRFTSTSAPDPSKCWVCLRVSRTGRVLAGLPDWRQATFQVIVHPGGLLMGIYHAGAFESPDRNYLQDELRRPAACARIVAALGGLARAGLDYTWHIGPFPADQAEGFSLSGARPADEFPEWYRQRDSMSVESLLIRRFRPDDECVKDLTSLKQTFLEVITELRPVFQNVALHL